MDAHTTALVDARIGNLRAPHAVLNAALIHLILRCKPHLYNHHDDDLFALNKIQRGTKLNIDASRWISIAEKSSAIIASSRCQNFGIQSSNKCKGQSVWENLAICSARFPRFFLARTAQLKHARPMELIWNRKVFPLSLTPENEKMLDNYWNVRRAMTNVSPGILDCSDWEINTGRNPAQDARGGRAKKYEEKASGVEKHALRCD